MAEGAHSHDDGNPLGLHSHPEIGISAASGDHDHALDEFGYHIHRGEDDRILVGYGGLHVHGVDAAEVESVHSHIVLGDVGRDGNPLEIQVAKATGLIVVEKTTHLLVDGDETEAVKIAKSHGSDFVDERGLLICFRTDDRCSSRFYTASDWSELMKRRDVVLDDAKLIAKTIGNAEVCEVFGRCGSTLIARRGQTFHVPNFIDVDKAKKDKGPDAVFLPAGEGKKDHKLDISSFAAAKAALKKLDTIKPPLSNADKSKAKKTITSRYPFLKIMAMKKAASSIHSINLEKVKFPDPPAMEKWIKDNGFSSDRSFESDTSVTYLQHEAVSDTPEFETRDVATGVLANFEKTDTFQIDVEFCKDSMNDEERTVEGLVYAPSTEEEDDADSQGDWATEEDIREAAHHFIENGLTKNVDHEHNFEKNGCTVVESFIAKVADPNYKKGSWVVKVKVHCEKMWDMVKSGAINGFSMAGNGVRVYDEVEETTSPMLGGFAFALGNEAVTKSANDVAKKKQRTRLTKIRPAWISLVFAGANLKDFSIVKSEAGVDIWKSRDQQIIDGDITFENERTIFDAISGLFKKYLGGTSPGVDTVQNVPVATAATGCGKVIMPNVDPVDAGLFSLSSQLDARLAQTEKILKALLGNEGFAPFLKANPAVVEALAKIGSEETTDIAKLAEFVQQGSENNGVTLPSPTNFFGFAGATMNPSSFLSRAESGGSVFPGGGMGTGSPASGNDSGMAKKLSDLEKQFAAYQIEVNGRTAFDPSQLEGFTKSLAALKDKLDAVVKAQDPVPAPAPMPTPIVKAEGQPDPEPVVPEENDPILKAKNNEQPFATDPSAIFGGISNSGKEDWLKK